MELPDERFEFITTDGMGEFYGQLIHVMAGLISLPQVHCDGHRKVEFREIDNRRILTGRVCWDYLGTYSIWDLTHDVTESRSWHEDFQLQLEIEELGYEREVITKRTLLLSFKEFCYAVLRCGTELLRNYGILGYTQMAEEYEDFNLREFLELKTYVLGVEDEVWCGMRVECRSDLQKELQLLLFEM